MRKNIFTKILKDILGAVLLHKKFTVLNNGLSMEERNNLLINKIKLQIEEKVESVKAIRKL